jgi:hypothetical protein
VKIRYVGESFGISGLTNGAVYECLGVEDGGDLGPMLRIVDDDANDWNYDNRPDWQPGYLFPANNPRPLDGSSPGGRWEIVEDDDRGTMEKAMSLQ